MTITRRSLADLIQANTPGNTTIPEVPGSAEISQISQEDFKRTLKDCCLSVILVYTSLYDPPKEGAALFCKVCTNRIERREGNWISSGGGMKTTTSEVGCDGCGATIVVMHPTAIFVTLRGPKIGHKKLDFHDRICLQRWVENNQHSGVLG